MFCDEALSESGTALVCRIPVTVKTTYDVLLNDLVQESIISVSEHKTVIKMICL